MTGGKATPVLRTPHVYVAALAAGLAAANAGRTTSVYVVVASSLAAVCAFAARGPSRVALVAVAVALAGLWWGSVRADALDRSVLREHVSRVGPARVVATAPPRLGQFSVRAVVRVKRFGRVRLNEPALLKLPRGRAPPQGAVLEAIATVVAPAEERNGFDERAWLARQGIHVVLRAQRWRAVGRRGGLGGVADRLRARIGTALRPALSGERRAVVAGVVLGDDHGLDEELRERFRASGLYHLLAVSGQNVALVAGGALVLAWLLAFPRWVGHVAALCAIAAYVLAVGAQPSVLRAGIAGALASLAWLAARPRDRWYFFLLGAAALLAWNPYLLLDAGFQLSFTAVASIFVLVPRLRRFLAGYPLPRALADVIAVSAACGFATAPIVWLHFDAVPLLAVPANALAFPAVVPLLGLALAAALVGTFSPAAAAALAWLSGWCGAYLAACARLVGSLPGAQLRSGFALAVAAALLGVLLAGTRLSPPRAARTVVLLALVLVVAAGWRYRPSDPPLRTPAGLRITFLDVGQGDATLLQVPQGAVLIDQGPPEARVADQLRRLGVRSLTAVLMTHPSRDNIGGAEEIVRELDVDAVLDPGLPFDNPFGRPALAAARERGIPTGTARAGAVYRIGRLTLRVLWPPGTADRGDDPNDHATVVLASFGTTDALLPADAESNVTLPLRAPPVEILKVAHHGSADPGLSELLRLLDPDVAVVSVGADNDYGHPAPSTLAALADVPGLAVHRTDRDGRIVIESDGRRIRVTDER